MAVIDDVLRQAQRDLAAQEAQIVRILVDDYALVARRIDRELRTITAQIAELIATGQDVPATWLSRQQWFRDMESSVQREMLRWTDALASGVQAAQQTGVAAGVGVAGDIAAIARTQLTGRVYAEAFERWVSIRQLGSPLHAVLDQFGPDAAAIIRQRLTEGIGSGQGVDHIVREIMRDLDGLVSETRVTTIARTATMRSYRGASAETMQQLADRGVVTSGVWLSALDSNTCLACIARHGQRYPMNQLPDDQHPNCRCVIRYEASEGIVPGGGWRGQTGAEWFGRQPADIQRMMLLSDRRYDAYQAGMPITEMVSVRHSPVWGATVGIRPVRELAGRAA